MIGGAILSHGNRREKWTDDDLWYIYTEASIIEEPKKNWYSRCWVHDMEPRSRASSLSYPGFPRTAKESTNFLALTTDSLPIEVIAPNTIIIKLRAITFFEQDCTLQMTLP